jgi:competence protein ComEC
LLLIYISCIWVAGIFIGYKLDLPPLLGLATLVPLSLLFFLRRQRKTLLLAALGIVLLVGAASYSYSSLYKIDESSVRYYNDSGTVTITGTVAGDPDVRDKNTRLTLAAAEIKSDTSRLDIEGTVLVFVPRYPSYEYGDVLRITGELDTPPVLDDFDYRGYLAHQGVYSTMFYPDIAVLETGKGFTPLAWVYSLRGRLAQEIAEVLPEPQASLAQGMVLGIRGNIPQEIRDDFSHSGTAHLLAISGLHLGIIAGILLGIGLWLFGRRHYLYVWLALGAVWIYTVITGMNPPVVRGAIMVSIFLLAEALGRQRSAIVALTFAAAVMVGVSPYILGDAAFQLSFLAMAGLIFIFPILRDLGRRATAAALGEEGIIAATANVVVDTVSATMGAIIAVWPVVAYYFGIVSLMGPLATLLALPALPAIIITGVLAGALGMAVPFIGQAVGCLAWLFLSYLALVIGGLGSAPVSAVGIEPFHPAFIWGYYLLLAAAIWLVNYRKKLRGLVSGTTGRVRAGVNLSFGFKSVRKWLIVPLALAALLVSFTAATMPGNDLRVSFLDVGEGDAVFIQKGNKQVLIDGGPSPQAIGIELSRQMPFWDRTIDLLVMTHPHQDHLAGLVEVLRRYRVGQVLYAPQDYASPLYDEWLRIIDEKGIDSSLARAGQSIIVSEGAVMKILHPPEKLMAGTESDIDNNSVVLLLSFGDVSFLLTGDIMIDAERELIRGRADIAGDILKAAHHGSDTSTTPEFLAVVSPQVAVISCGAGNRFGHPDTEVIDRLVIEVGPDNIYRTDERGAIEFATDGERLWVDVEK